MHLAFATVEQKKLTISMPLRCVYTVRCPTLKVNGACEMVFFHIFLISNIKSKRFIILLKQMKAD